MIPHLHLTSFCNTIPSHQLLCTLISAASHTLTLRKKLPRSLTLSPNLLCTTSHRNTTCSWPTQTQKQPSNTIAKDSHFHITIYSILPQSQQCNLTNDRPTQTQEIQCLRKNRVSYKPSKKLATVVRTLPSHNT
jgi:hypothetical protein